ncbi:malonyl CoA-acyl carrier protein transacylase FabD [Peptoclostridium acidaminophilum DSM 3953]|uniref:Malonyl CoA-acyl carrier protein transacylase n=1 Tax=Peptoclostridium acidaminophilum DSM 3953 TaxID=1286171 RepID=W8TJU4_PEPAC|nr:ACP S-malonyltransferase [Peptoclostridium acidaminophilum]AHM56487.1 malonyl CoA-acyl carrier protein transacylase FabD [Peptoclostridium acidaminophilum DSM 3953]
MGKLAVVFPGQGAQYVGMGKDIYESFETARKIIDRANEILGVDIKKLMFEGPEEDLRLTENTQPAILVHSIAMYEVLKESLPLDINAAAGLSLGEYSALVASGSFDFEKAVTFVKKRGQIMQDEVSSDSGTMAAILGLDREILVQVVEECKSLGVIEAANFNCPGQIVISGEMRPVEEAVKLCKERGAKKAVMLSVSGPFHTSMLLGAGEKLGKELESVDIVEGSFPVVSNVTGDYAKPGDVKELLVRQVSSSVLWEDSISRLIDDGFDTFIEVGPGKTLTGFINKIAKSKKGLSKRRQC